METLFTKIINKEIPADIIYEDELSLVFKDINPQAPTHLLIIPKKPIPKLSDATEEDKEEQFMIAPRDKRRGLIMLLNQVFKPTDVIVTTLDAGDLPTGQGPAVGSNEFARQQYACQSGM